MRVTFDCPNSIVGSPILAIRCWSGLTMHFCPMELLLLTGSFLSLSFFSSSPVNEDLQIFSYSDQLPLSEIIHQVGETHNHQAQLCFCPLHTIYIVLQFKRAWKLFEISILLIWQTLTAQIWIHWKLWPWLISEILDLAVVISRTYWIRITAGGWLRLTFDHKLI